MTKTDSFEETVTDMSVLNYQQEEDDYTKKTIALRKDSVMKVIHDHEQNSARRLTDYIKSKRRGTGVMHPID